MNDLKVQQASERVKKAYEELAAASHEYLLAIEATAEEVEQATDQLQYLAIDEPEDVTDRHGWEADLADQIIVEREWKEVSDE